MLQAVVVPRAIVGAGWRSTLAVGVRVEMQPGAWEVLCCTIPSNRSDVTS